MDGIYEMDRVDGNCRRLSPLVAIAQILKSRQTISVGTERNIGISYMVCYVGIGDKSWELVPAEVRTLWVSGFLYCCFGSSRDPSHNQSSSFPTPIPLILINWTTQIGVFGIAVHKEFNLGLLPPESSTVSQIWTSGLCWWFEKQLPNSEFIINTLTSGILDRWKSCALRLVHSRSRAYSSSTQKM